MDRRSKIETLVKEANELRIVMRSYAPTESYSVAPKALSMIRTIVIVVSIGFIMSSCDGTFESLLAKIGTCGIVFVVWLGIFSILYAGTNRVFWLCTQKELDDLQKTIEIRRELIAKEKAQRLSEETYLSAVTETIDEVKSLGGDLNLDAWLLYQERTAGTKGYALLFWREFDGSWTKAANIYFEPNGVDELYHQIMLRRYLQTPNLREDLISQYKKERGIK